MASEESSSAAKETHTARQRELSEAAEKAAEKARVVATHVGKGLKSGVTAGANGVKKGLATAQARIDANERAWDARSAGTDMPAISLETPLLDLATRLDKQADFFRELAVEAMRPTVSRHVLHALAVMLTALSIVLSTGLAWQVFTGNEHAMFLASAGVDAGSAVLAIALGLWLERTRMKVAEAALEHATRAETALERIAITLSAGPASGPSQEK